MSNSDEDSDLSYTHNNRPSETETNSPLSNMVATHGFVTQLPDGALFRK